MSARPLALVLMALAPLGGVLATAAAGETPPPTDVAPGSRVRLTIRGEVAALSGRLVSADGTGLVLENDEGHVRRTLRWESIDALDVGRRSVAAGLGAGVLAGAGTAVILGAAENGSSDGRLYAALGGALLALPAAGVGVAAGGGPRPTTNGALSGAAIAALALGAVGAAGCSSGPVGDTAPECILVSAIVGAGWGALAGGVAGHVSRERWRPAWKRGVSVGLGPVRGPGLVVAIRLSM